MTAIDDAPLIDDSPLIDVRTLEDLEPLREEFARFMMEFKFGIDEVTTKISILQEEFTHLHDYNPIEHVLSRVKSPQSILAKLERLGGGASFDDIRESITDVAGIRVTCSFVSDVYRVFDLLAGQPDLEVLQVEDYVANPKPNGYRSLHALVQVPVHLSDRIVPVTVELQIRTVAMDFWASLEHKIYYKYRAQVPDGLRHDLKVAAETAAELETVMERLHEQAHGDGTTRKDARGGQVVASELVVQQLHALQLRLNREV